MDLVESIPWGIDYCLRAVGKAFHRRLISDGDIAHTWYASYLLGHLPKIVR